MTQRPFHRRRGVPTRRLPAALLAALLLCACAERQLPAAGEAAQGAGQSHHSEPQDSDVAAAEAAPEGPSAGVPAGASTGESAGAAAVLPAGHPYRSGTRPAGEGTPTGDRPMLAKAAAADLEGRPHRRHPPQPPGPPHQLHVDGERYPAAQDNPVRLTREHPVSTFAVDVDSASYANVRRLLEGGQRPPRDAVRIEELINYFDYDYPAPQDDAAFAIYTELGPSPWHDDRRLLHIGIQGHDLGLADLPPANLVFLVDVSGSMNHPAKLPLLQSALKLLARELGPQDRISLVAYAGAAGAVLAPTAGDQRGAILAAIDGLHAGGSTNGGAGIELAYRLAQQTFIDGGINRVILATDGDFNVGAVSLDALKTLISDKRRSGIALSVLGFGTGNTNDALMQELAQNGDGNAAYIDSLTEARKVLVDERAATLMTVARDVKIQVEFNPAQVAEYRLLGFETRALAREDFNNDAVDAGDIGAGHTVTALYELALTGSAGRQVDPLRYGGSSGAASPPAPAAAGEAEGSRAAEVAFVKLRYKPADADGSRLLTRAVTAGGLPVPLADTSERYRFAAAVAAFGQALRGTPQLGAFGLLDAAALAVSVRGEDRFGYRSEFLQLARTADALVGPRGRSGG